MDLLYYGNIFLIFELDVSRIIMKIYILVFEMTYSKSYFRIEKLNYTFEITYYEIWNLAFEIDCSTSKILFF